MTFLLAVAVMMNPGILKIGITGLDGTEGFIRIALFDSAEFFPEDIDHALLRVTEPATSESITVEISGIEYGTYAVALFHDKDGDAVLDRNFLGLPTEKIGFSSGARAMTGPPDYEDALFSFETDTLFILVELH